MYPAYYVAEIGAHEIAQSVQRRLALIDDGIAIGDCGDGALIPKVFVGRRLGAILVDAHEF